MGMVGDNKIKNTNKYVKFILITPLYPQLLREE
jgi:hypothetical protein